MPSRNELDGSTQPWATGCHPEWCASSNMPMKKAERLVFSRLGWHHSVEKPRPELPRAVGGRATRRWRSKPCRNEQTMHSSPLQGIASSGGNGRLARASDVIFGLQELARCVKCFSCTLSTTFQVEAKDGSISKAVSVPHFQAPPSWQWTGPLRVCPGSRFEASV